MRNRTSLFTVLAGLVLAFGATGAWAQAREEGRLLMASQVLEELRSSRDQVIPDRLLERAYGIAVIPDMTKAAFFFGGRHGNGALVVRDKDGRFTNPIFISMTGGSFGWQWGVQSIDIVLVFTSRKGVEGITGGKVTLGADASVAAGPVGRQASAATDTSFKAEVYSYSRTRGIFAGLALDGTVLSIDDDANAAFYRKSSVMPSDIIAGNVHSPDDSAKRFLAAIGTSTRTASSSVPATASAPTPAPAQGAPRSDAPSSSPSSGAQTFPMADPTPGAEPK
ncbi:MAG TPA: lipid-binding SYLF domain-containing protein [Steroidobacteraceae bacterium]|nr:lipid-binding SYLF domain-containing protein [Steroidobacteraceae bacterium]